MSERVCILGGTGFVGSRLAARLSRTGHGVTVLSRDLEAHPSLRVLPGVEVRNCAVHDPAQLAAAMRGHSAIVNLVGILNERGFGGDGFRRAHVELTRAALEACRSVGARRYLQVSALGAAEDGPSHYLRSKGAAERLVRESCEDLGWSIFRPSVIFGPGDSFLNRFAALLAAVPFVFPLAMADARMQPVFVDDVVEALAAGVEGRAAAHRVYELGGPRVYRLGEIVEFVAAAVGLRRRVLPLPRWASRMQALAMDFVPGRPFSTDNFRSLTVDSVCHDDGFGRLGFAPRPMDGMAQLYLGACAAHRRLGDYRRRAGREL